ncbi:receptor-interacting serine/threonine-protein kinase 3-like isoform X2 [Tiliqua scincoides]|uniref:receptor-interacting serine/threonine-protein kinase 3-like isoform X2 n=1 Tax=Tiliqua scincoides TaxID=71010 RepID=UPI003462A188
MASPNQFCDEITRDCLTNFQFIGQGAFGTIHQARHQDWGIDVAVKILNSDTACTREELLNEARAMDKARFTYVVRLFGLFVDKVPTATKAGNLGGAMPRLGLVMEFMENGSLASLQSRVPLVPWALRLRVLHEVALGMNFLHSLKPPVLHLDLKPSNVLLDAELHIRVADFGLSKCKRGTSRRSLSHGEGDGYGGTLEYMPPEAFTDMNYKPSTGADVYSYGILMWSLLTGEEPYPHIHPSNMSSLIKIHIPQGQRPSTEELEKRIHEVRKLEEMIRLMKWCWHNEKARRPSFRDCSQETEGVFSSYKPEIMAAVREVQDILVRMDSSPATERSSSSSSSSLTPLRSSPASCRSKCFQSQCSANSPPGLEEHFETLRLQESPPRQNEAVPIKPFSHIKQKWKPSPHFQRSSSMCFGKSFYVPYQGDTGLTPGHSSFLPSFNPGSPQGRGGIHIHGHGIQGIQVGGGNFMHIELASGSKPQKKK